MEEWLRNVLQSQQMQNALKYLSIQLSRKFDAGKITGKLNEAAVSPFESDSLSDSVSAEVARTVIRHAAAAATAAMTSGFVPGAGAFVATGVVIAAIWRMFRKISTICGIDIAQEKLKTVATAVLSNLTAKIAGLLALEFMTGFLPGAGILVGGAVNFVIVYFAGLIFIRTLTAVLESEAEGEPDEETLKREAEEAVNGMNAKAVIHEARSIFRDMRKDGSLKNVGETIDIEPEDQEEV